ncbi:conserved hypothetical protein [Pediculus humanus corporis]|uniref:ABC1 atypical kinase-like domain-containing protein n=1 Tax=Pediculus humanus subsp. corporis TaxID=121224 RepID=E0VM36_PEDHC|nr:uncharacterized protein Phum_PHUM299980 [Pediculus humanus corporis]EEB14442.1 conserved hypothetical protein [Pediculus humanus corporis]
MSKILLSDLKAYCRSMELIFKESFKYHQTSLEKFWENSSINVAIEENIKSHFNNLKNVSTNDLALAVKESYERASMVPQSLKVYAMTSTKSQGDVDYEKKNDANDEEVLPKGVSPEDLKASELHYKDRELIEKLEKEHEQKLKKQAEMEQNIKQLHQSSIKSESLVNNLDDNVSNTKTDVVLEKNIPLPSTKKYKPKQQLNPEAKQRKVPSTRLGRMISFGSLAAGLGIGALAEVTRRTIVLNTELGSDWKDKLSHFEEKPFAAASIGQVHYIRLKDGRECAMKIQYPGVAQGIESDINNLVGILKVWNVFPEGLFIDNLVEVAKRELSWEVDYEREAECTKKFKKLLLPYPDYVVPDVIDELSTKQIFTSTLIEGIPVDQCADLPEKDREHVCILIMQLCLREIFEFRYMQTDPNWSNFFYEPTSKKMCLLDFGATRSYEYEFVKKYIENIRAAAEGDRQAVLNISKEMGFLTGYESKKMQNAHVDAVMILAEVFSAEKAFDFGLQDTTRRIQKLVPTIVTERLCPPPEEIYSLHRKLSGVFLLCAKLKVKISCREMFFTVYNKFKSTSNEF